MKPDFVHKRFAWTMVALMGAITMQAQVFSGVNPYLSSSAMAADTMRYNPPSRDLNSLDWGNMRFQMQNGSRVITWDEVQRQLNAEPLSDDGRQLVRLQRVVFYEIRQSDNVSFTSQMVMNEIAEFMATCQDAHINVVGFADRGTGNESLNAMYSQRRAMQFKDDMVNRYGINPNSITTDAKGDYVQPFSENNKNRCVIVDGYGYLPVTPAQAVEVPEVKERIIYERDTVFIDRTDTLFMAVVDSLKPERPFGLNKEHRWQNWFVNVGGGPAIFQGDHNIDAVYKDRIYPQFNFSLGKWIYPALGVRMGVDYDKVHLFYNSMVPIHYAGLYEKRPWLSKMKYDTFNFRFDVMLNLSSFWWRPYKKRFWSCIPFVGIGYIVTWDEPFGDSMSLNFGLLNSFRISEMIDLNLEIRSKRFSDKMNTYIQGHKDEGMTYIGVGFTWHFTKRGF